MDNTNGQEDQNESLDILIQKRYDEWIRDDPSIDTSDGMTYKQFQLFLKTKMEEGMFEDEQFIAVCQGLDPESTGFIKIQDFINSVSGFQDEMMMQEL